MNRRSLLVHTGTVVGLAGCLGDAATSDDPADGDGQGGQTASTSPDIGARPCPPYETDRDTAVCSHTVDADTAAVSLEPTPEHSSLTDGTPADEITLTFHNRSAGELTFNPHSWRIHRTSGNGWAELQQEVSGDGRLTVSPGETRSWSFMDAVESIRTDPALAPGLYAAELGVPDPGNRDDWIACIALVRLTA